MDLLLVISGKATLFCNWEVDTFKDYTSIIKKNINTDNLDGSMCLEFILTPKLFASIKLCLKC